MNLGPEVFRPEAVDPETAAHNQWLEGVLAEVPPIYTQEPAQVRAARRQGRGWAGPIVYSESASERAIDGPAGKIGLRCFLPPKVEGVYLHMHGGGWVLGASDMQDPALETLANACNLAVLSVEYRLAPEHPYPSGPDDCEAAALWLAQNAAAEFGTDRLAIGGESAGAQLAVVSLLRLRDRHGLQPFRAACLAFGVFDLRATPSLRNWGERNLVLSTPAMYWFFDHFVPPDKRDDPDVSPLLADLRGLPPALFSVGTLDPLLDDSIFMHARWLAAGNESHLDIYPGGVHGFKSMPTPVGRSCVETEHAFLREKLLARA